MSDKIITIPAENDLIAARIAVRAEEDTFLRFAGNYDVWTREEMGARFAQADPAAKRTLRVGKRDFKEFFFFRRTSLSVGWGLGPFDIPDGQPKFRMRGKAVFEIVNAAPLMTFSHTACWTAAADGLSLLYGYKFDFKSGESGLACYLRGQILERLKRDFSALGSATREQVETLLTGEDFWSVCGAAQAPTLGEFFVGPAD